MVLPEGYRNEVMRVAHDLPMSGHLGVRKTQDRILQHFYWPGIHKEVTEFCRTCHVCQMVGKPNPPVKVAPLIPSYLGYTIGQGQVAAKMAKVEAVETFPTPTGKKQIMQFLGTIGYYRKFCENFAEVSAPLTDMLCKNVKFVWTPECQESFEALKLLLMQAPVLSMPDYSKPFMLLVDASDIGVGAVLMQKETDGLDHPVAYFSKKLNRYQKNYSTIEKETLSLILAIQHFEIYVSAGEYPVEVFTDHNPLKYLHRFRNKNQRLTRWSLFLQEYDLIIQHIPGKDNVIADCLSRNM